MVDPKEWAQAYNYFSSKFKSRDDLSKFFEEVQKDMNIPDWRGWAAIGNMSEDEIKLFADMVRWQSGKGGPLGIQEEAINKWRELSAAEAGPTSALDTPEGQGISSQIQAFINSMMGPVGPGDATYDTIMRSATNAAQAYGGKAGLNARSSLGNTAAGSLATAGVAAYEQQRRELGLQGMNALSNRDIQLGQLQQQWVAMQNGIAEQKASAEQAQRTATGQVVGGVIGAIPGIIAAPYTGGASLGLIGAGSAIGGGWAGSTSSAPKYQTNYSGPKGRNPYTGF